MNLTTQHRPSRTRKLLLGATGAALLTLASCSGGGGGGGVVAPAAGPLDGNWNFFRTAGVGACNDFEFAAFPMTLNHVSDVQVDVLIGDPGSEFVFSGGYDPSTNTINVTGTDTVDGTTIQINNAFWQLDPASTVLFGQMDVIRTEPGQAPCNVFDFIEGYRADATQTSPLAQPIGDEPFFELTLEVLASDDPDRVGRVSEGLGIFYPQRQDAHTLEIYDPSDDSSTFFRDVTLIGTSVNMPPTDAEQNVQIIGSNLVLDPATNVVSGQVQAFSVGDGNETIEFTATPFMYAPTTNPFFTDDDAPTGFGVNVADLQTQIPLVGDPGGAASQVNGGAAFALTGTPDAARKRYSGVQQSAMYYVRSSLQAPAGVGDLRRVRPDLSTDGGGQGFDVILADAVFDQPLSGLWVESDMQAGGRDCLTFTINGDADQSYALVVGAGAPALQQMAGRAIAPVRDPQTGAFKGWVTESSTVGMVLRDEFGTQVSLLSAAQQQPMQYLGTTDSGTLFLSVWPDGDPTGKIAVLPHDQQAFSVTIGGLNAPLPNNVVPADVEGETLYFGQLDVNTSALGILSAETDGQAAILAAEFAWQTADPRCELVVAGSRVVYTIVEDNGVEPVILRSVRLDGTDNVELDRVGGHIDIVAASDGQVFYNDSFFPGGAAVTARSRSIHGDDAGPVEYDESSTWAAIQARPTLDFAHGPRVGAAIGALAPGHEAQSVILIDRRNGNEQVVAVDAKSGAAVAVAYDRDFDLGAGFELSEISSGYQPLLLAEIGTLGPDLDVYQLDASGSSLVAPITATPGVNEDILSR